MPVTPKGIRTPSDTIKISALGVAMRDLAADVDELLTPVNPYIGESLPAHVQQRFEFVEKLAGEAGTRTVNLIADPHPVDPAKTYVTGHIRSVLPPSPNYARAVAAGTGSTSIIPILANGNVRDPLIAVTAGQNIGFSIALRAMDGQDISATVYVEGYAAGVSKGNVITDGQHTMPGGEVRRYRAIGTIPAGIDQVRLRITFRTRGETYAAAGHMLYWREAALYLGTIPANADFTSGNGASSYWSGTPNNSSSVTIKPRATATDSLADAFRRDVIVDAGIKRRGGVIGTNGLPAVSLRFDHHLPNFKTKVLPLLKQHRLPWSQMINSGRVLDGSEGMTFAELAAECYNSGGEVWNHGLTHSDIPDKAAADREVTGGFDELIAGLPNLWIDGWVGPGQTNMMGMEGSNAPEKFYGTYPGRLALARHAFIQGHYPGIHQPMAGPNLIGHPHQTIDTLAADRVEASLRAVIAAKAGLIFMLHPNYLDTAGYMTSADLATILASIAAKRDAGELLVLTSTAILLADVSTSHRRNLLTQGRAGSTDTGWEETVNGRHGMTQYGVPHELVVTVKAKKAGTVMLNLKESASPIRFDSLDSRTLAAGQTATLRCLVTFPLDCAGITAKLTGAVDYSDIELHAV